MRRRRAVATALLVASVARPRAADEATLNFINLTNGMKRCPCWTTARRSAASNHPDVKRTIFMASCRTWTTLAVSFETGAECRIYDGSGERGGPAKLSKKYMCHLVGLVWVRYALGGGKIPHASTPTLRGYNVETLFRRNLGDYLNQSTKN